MSRKAQTRSGGTEGSNPSSSTGESHVCEPDPEPFCHTSRKGPGDHPRVRIKIIANSEAIAVRFQNICIA